MCMPAKIERITYFLHGEEGDFYCWSIHIRLQLSSFQPDGLDSLLLQLLLVSIQEVTGRHLFFTPGFFLLSPF